MKLHPHRSSWLDPFQRVPAHRRSRLPELYINRELSQLQFNRRVLAQAMDESNPLLERVKFLCIASSTLDEFFEIRVAGLKQQVAFGSLQSGPDQIVPVEQLKAISASTHELVDEQYRIRNEELLPQLAFERGSPRASSTSAAHNHWVHPSTVTGCTPGFSRTIFQERACVPGPPALL